MVANFKVGDWIVNDQHEVFRIEKVGLENYTFEDVSGYNPSIRDVDNDFHLWDIENDAKKGDILASNMSIILFDELTHVGLFYGTCEYNLEKDQLEFPMPIYQKYRKYYYPASEKQRQFFIKKLRDAGYKINSGGNLEELPPKTPEELINEIDISDEIKHTISSNFEFEELSSASVNDFIKGYERGMERMKQLILDKLNKK